MAANLLIRNNTKVEALKYTHAWKKFSLYKMIAMYQVLIITLILENPPHERSFCTCVLKYRMQMRNMFSSLSSLRICLPISLIQEILHSEFLDLFLFSSCLLPSPFLFLSLPLFHVLSLPISLSLSRSLSLSLFYPFLYLYVSPSISGKHKTAILH